MLKRPTRGLLDVIRTNDTLKNVTERFNMRPRYIHARYGLFEVTFDQCKKNVVNQGMKLKFLLEPLGNSIFQSGGQFHKKQNQTKKLEQKPKEGENGRGTQRSLKFIRLLRVVFFSAGVITTRNNRMKFRLP